MTCHFHAFRKIRAMAPESRSGESAQKKLLDTKSKPKIDLAALTCVAFY